MTDLEYVKAKDVKAGDILIATSSDDCFTTGKECVVSHDDRRGSGSNAHRDHTIWPQTRATPSMRRSTLETTYIGFIKK